MIPQRIFILKFLYKFPYLPIEDAGIRCPLTNKAFFDGYHHGLRWGLDIKSVRLYLNPASLLNMLVIWYFTKPAISVIHPICCLKMYE